MDVPNPVPPVIPAGTMAGRDQPSPTGPGLVPRPWRPADAGALGRASDDPDLRRRPGRSTTAAQPHTWIDAAHRRRQAETAAGWSIGELGRHRPEIEHATGNAASCRTSERAGYPLEGVERSHTRLPDGWHDGHLHVLVGPEPHDHP